ncbi:MAG TPA: hypothetical protein P5267_00690, partial [Patescibacteria group bacterium]|nr:hypothetical protein [Patescibacteria group bacterium]
MEPTYRPILKRAWQIAWRFKYLWFFGLFAALLGTGGMYNINFSVDEASNQGNWLMSLKGFLSGESATGLTWDKLVANMNIWIVVLFLMLLLAGLFLLWLSVVSQGALIYGVKEANQGRTLLFGQAFAKGREKFWSLLALNLVMGLIALAILMIVTLPFLILVFKPQYATTAASLFIAASFMVMVPLGVVISFVIRYSLFFIVNKDRSIKAAISEGWRMFKRNWLPSAEMAVVVWLVYMAVGLVLFLVVKYLVLPAVTFIFTMLVSTYVGSETLIVIMVSLALLFYAVVMLWVRAVLNVFEISSWVLLFEKLNNEGV